MDLNKAVEMYITNAVGLWRETHINWPSDVAIPDYVLREIRKDSLIFAAGVEQGWGMALSATRERLVAV